MLAPDRTLSVLPQARNSRLSYARLRAPTPLPRLHESMMAGYLRRLLWRFSGA